MRRGNSNHRTGAVTRAVRSPPGEASPAGTADTLAKGSSTFAGVCHKGWRTAAAAHLHRCQPPNHVGGEGAHGNHMATACGNWEKFGLLGGEPQLTFPNGVSSSSVALTTAAVLGDQPALVGLQQVVKPPANLVRVTGLHENDADLLHDDGLNSKPTAPLNFVTLLREDDAELLHDCDINADSDFVDGMSGSSVSTTSAVMQDQPGLGPGYNKLQKKHADLLHDRDFNAKPSFVDGARTESSAVLGVKGDQSAHLGLEWVSRPYADLATLLHENANDHLCSKLGFPDGTSGPSATCVVVDQPVLGKSSTNTFMQTNTTTHHVLNSNDVCKVSTKFRTNGPLRGPHSSARGSTLASMALLGMFTAQFATVLCDEDPSAQMGGVCPGESYLWRYPEETSDPSDACTESFECYDEATQLCLSVSTRFSHSAQCDEAWASAMTEKEDTGVLTVPACARSIPEGAFVEWVDIEDISDLRSIWDICADNGRNVHTCPYIRPITQLVFEPGGNLISIDQFAFRGTVELTGTVTIPATVEFISHGAFYGSAFEGLVFESGSNLISIGASAFCDLRLRSVTIPASVETIESLAFGYTAFSSLDFEPGSNLVQVYPTAFMSTNLLSVALPTSVVFPEADSETSGVNEKKAQACQEFPALWSLYLQKHFCGGAPDLNLETFSHPALCGQLGGSIYCHAGNTGLDCLETCETGTVVIPASTESVDAFAFTQCDVTALEFAPGSNVQTIGPSAFEGLTDFGYTGLTELTIPATVRAIGARSFGRAGLTSLVFERGSNLISIGRAAFYWNAISGTLTIPASVETIESAAFFMCNELTELVFEPGSLLTIGSYAFTGGGGTYSSTALASPFIGALTGILTIPASVESIGPSAFAYNIRVTRLVFAPGSNLTFIGDRAFEGLARLQAVTLPASVVHLGEGAFDAGVKLCGGDPSLLWQGRPLETDPSMCGCPGGQYMSLDGGGCLECDRPELCLADGHCATGYADLGCMSCDNRADPPWAPMLDKCVQCAEPGGTYFLLMIMAVILTLFTLHVAAPHEHATRLSSNVVSLLRHAQILSFSFRVDIQLPTLFEWSWKWFAIGALFKPIDVVPPECHAEWLYEQDYRETCIAEHDEYLSTYGEDDGCFEEGAAETHWEFTPGGKRSYYCAPAEEYCTYNNPSQEFYRLPLPMHQAKVFVTARLLIQGLVVVVLLLTLIAYFQNRCHKKRSKDAEDAEDGTGPPASRAANARLVLFGFIFCGMADLLFVNMFKCKPPPPGAVCVAGEGHPDDPLSTSTCDLMIHELDSQGKCSPFCESMYENCTNSGTKADGEAFGYSVPCDTYDLEVSAEIPYTPPGTAHYEAGYHYCVGASSPAARLAIAVLVLPVLLTWIMLATPLGGKTIRHGHAWAAPYRTGFHHFEGVSYLTKLTVCYVASAFYFEPLLQLEILGAVAAIRLGLHVTFLPLVDGVKQDMSGWTEDEQQAYAASVEDRHWSQPNRLETTTLVCELGATMFMLVASQTVDREPGGTFDNVLSMFLFIFAYGPQIHALISTTWKDKLDDSKEIDCDGWRRERAMISCCCPCCGGTNYDSDDEDAVRMDNPLEKE